MTRNTPLRARKRDSSASRRLVSAVLAVATLAGGLLLAPQAAQAAYGAMIQPASGLIVSRVGDGCGEARPDHQGIDISHNDGASIVAAYGGVVQAAGYSSGYGNYVQISHPGGYSTLYGHMRNTPMVVAGNTVSAGQQLGIVGNTGNSTGPHLHFEIYRNGANIANNGYACGTNVTQGAAIPMDFPGLGGSTPARFDLNGDGKSDLLAIRNDGYLVEFFGDGAGGTQLTYPVGPGWSTSTAIVHGDYDCNGAGDLLQARADGSLYFYAGDYASGFTPHYIGPGWHTFSLLTGGVDFTGDGKPDLVARASDGNLYAYPGNCSGGFGNPVQIGNGWSGMTALVAGDFNKDGRGDLIARNAAGELWGYYGTANGFGYIQQLGNGWNGFSTITGGGDYNGDGNPDIIARNGTDQTLWLYPGNGTGGFNAGIQVGNGWGAYTLIS